MGTDMRIRICALVIPVAAIVPLLLANAGMAAMAGASTASTAKTYVVVLKGNQKAGLAAVQRAGGRVLQVNKLGIGQVSSKNPSFLEAIRRSGAVDAAANDASWHLGKRDLVSVTYVPAAEQARNCSDFYQVPINVGPEPLSACEWDDRIINASPGKSYAVNRGAGASNGEMDTGIDLTHPDIAPNLDVGLSCSFITSANPNADPAEVANGDCSGGPGHNNSYGKGLVDALAAGGA